MKKWKVLLVMLCAMLVSIGLFACKSGDDEGEGGGKLPDNAITNITRVQGASNLSYTDNDTWSDILSDLQKSVKVTCKPSQGENITVNGADCNFTSTIEFDSKNHCEVGRYTIKISPKENNPKNLYRDVDVEITHKFEADADKGIDICDYCSATRTYADQKVIIHYGTFHTGTNATVPEKVYGEDGTNKKVFTDNSEKKYISDFGTVNVGGEDVKIPTLTVGRLEPGMTITVKGKAQTSWANWGVAENAYYYFPVIGIADRNNNTPKWEGKTVENDGYVGGTSVFIRGEGWVLYNGIGGASDKDRPLAALSSYSGGTFVDGRGEGRNYGSHELAELGDDEKRPASFTPGQIPDVKDWVDWVVYSTGNTSNSGDAYGDETEIELTWNYRQDQVIELTYNVNGSKLVCMVKVPDSSTGYYDTILHGDYVDMWIESYERIETLTPTGFSISVEDNKYFEGQTFDPATISAQFTYMQLSDPLPQALALENIFATEDETITENTVWVPMTTNPVSLKYKNYKVQVEKGGEKWIETFAAGELNIVSNVIETVVGANVGAYKNNNTVGKFTLGVSEDGKKVVLTPVGDVYAQAIPAGETFEGTTANHRYVALAIEALADKTLGTEITVKSGETEVPYIYDQENGTLVLALTAETKTVTITGLQDTPTVFDFSTVKGFKLSSTIELANGETSWYLNNDENQVTVTFKLNANETLDRVYIGGEQFRGIDAILEDVGSEFGTFELATGTAYDEETGILTLVINYYEANLADYAPQSIQFMVSGEFDFEYKIDYLPQFAANDTVDAGYYTFVSNGKIYLAKVATDIENGEDALTLNVNEGNDKIALLNLAYTYNATTGSASFKNAASLTGVEIKVVKVAGKDIVLIEVDPSQNGVTGNAYGYQIKTANFSDNFFAVSEDNAVKTAVAKDNSVIINEGSCLEKGLSGYVNTVGTAKFVASPVEFAGNHKLNGTQTGAVCEYCGEVLDRNKQWKTYTLHDNEYVEINASFTVGSVTLKSDKGEDAMWSGLYVKLEIGNKAYRVRNDGAIVDWTANTGVVDETITSSLDENGGARTPLGRLDADGNPITGPRYLETLNAGASFRVWVGYQDNALTVIWRIYKKGDSRIYYEFTHKFAQLSANELTVLFALDGATVGEGGSKGNANFIKGTIDKTMIEGVTDAVEDGNVVYSVGNVENHLATVSATSGNAATINDTVKGELGITDGYTKYVKLDIALKDAYTTGNALANVYTDASFSTLRAGAKAEFDADKKVITVTIALGEGDKAPATYYIGLKNTVGSTKQINVKLDLSAVSMLGTKGTVNTDNAALVKGGNVTIVYENISDLGDMTNAKFSINGVEKALNDLDFGDGLTATWNADNATLTISLPPQAKLTGIPQYTVALLDGEGNTAVTNVFQITNKPTAGGSIFEVNEDIYGYATGDKVYLYLFGGAATGSDYLVFNANNSASNKTAILPYSLAFSLSGTSVAFKSSNALTKDMVATYFVSGANKFTQLEIDLSALNIAADAAYYFDVLTEAINGSAAYYSVDADRTVAKTTVDTLPAKAAIIASSCTAVGSTGYAIMDNETVLGYYGIEVVPSHTWGTNAADATLFECTKCGAILKNNNAKGTLIPAAQFGEGKFNVTEGFTISYFQKSANSDWDSIVARTKYGAVNIDSPNLQTNVMTSVDGEAATLRTKLKNENVFPSTAGAVLESGYGWDTIKNTTNCYITVTIKKGVGIVYYLNGNKMLTYPATMQFGNSDGTVDDFIELFGLCAAREGVYVATTQFAGAIDAVDAIVQKTALSDEEAAARYQLYLQEREVLHELVAHTHAYTNADHTCLCGAIDPLYDYPTYNTNNTFDVGVATMDDAKTLAWVNYIQPGEKFVFTGTHKSNSNDNWAGINVALGSYKAVDSATIRVDRWVDGVDDGQDAGGTDAAENWTFTKSNMGFGDWTGVHAAARKDGNVTITIDWTTETQIEITIALEKDGTSTAFTYTFTATTGALRDRYNFALGCGLSYSSLTVTAAPTRSDAPTPVTPEA